MDDGAPATKGFEANGNDSANSTGTEYYCRKGRTSLHWCNSHLFVCRMPSAGFRFIPFCTSSSANKIQKIMKIGTTVINRLRFHYLINLQQKVSELMMEGKTKHTQTHKWNKKCNKTVCTQNTWMQCAHNHSFHYMLYNI